VGCLRAPDDREDATNVQRPTCGCQELFVNDNNILQLDHHSVGALRLARPEIHVPSFTLIRMLNCGPRPVPVTPTEQGNLQSFREHPSERCRYGPALHDSQLDVINASGPGGIAGMSRVALSRHQALAVIH